MKKLFSKFMCLILFMSCVFFISGTSIYDDQKNLAEAIATRLFMSDINPVEQVLYTHDLKSLDEENDYIIVEGSIKGYVVFSRKDLQIIEYSTEGRSPFNQRSKQECYYAGPANYFIKNNEDAEHVFTKEKIKKENFKAVAKKVKEQFSINKEEKIEKSDEKADKEEIIENSPMSLKIVENFGQSYIANMDPGPTGTGSAGAGFVDINEYEIVNQKYISNYQYFLHNPKHKNNVGDECVPVAVQILLAYNNWANDGRLIPEKYLLGTVAARRSPYDPKAIGTKDELFYEIRDNMIIFGNGALLTNAPYALEQYFQDNVSYEVSSKVGVEYSFWDIHNKIRDNINNDIPLAVSISAFKTSSSDDGQIEKYNHTVIVYGYQTFKINGENVEGYIAHFGWGNIALNAWFNKNWAIDCMTFSTQHQHLIEEPITIGPNDGHVVRCVDCNRYRIINEAHLFIRTPQKKLIENTASTIDPFLHYKVCFCGYKEPTSHIISSYSIINDNYEQHYKNCECGYVQKESHFFKYGNICFFCGFERL